MEKFLIEIFTEGEFLIDEAIESNQRLLNEKDLNTICIGKDVAPLFIRRQTEMNNGYFLDDSLRWDYGTREEALNIIKRRL